MNKKIFIYSGPTNSGKTTTLSKWLRNRDDAMGILSPKIDGLRYFENILTSELQLMDDPSGEIKIGRHRFSHNAFSWAKNILKNPPPRRLKWLILDEIGPLEIKNEEGFYDMIMAILADPKLDNMQFLFVIRSGLVEDFVQKLGLSNVQLISNDFLNQQKLPALDGLVLSGGESKRMHEDKSLLVYHGPEQWQYMCNVLRPMTREQWVSINRLQERNRNIDGQFAFLVDDPKYQNNGPMSGLMTAHILNPDRGMILAAIDYPKLQMQDIIQLYYARSEDYDAVCFEHEQTIQPLICLIEASGMEHLQAFFRNGGRSIKKFLDSINCYLIKPEKKDLFTNINTPEDWQTYWKEQKYRK